MSCLEADTERMDEQFDRDYEDALYKRSEEGPRVDKAIMQQIAQEIRQLKSQHKPVDKYYADSRYWELLDEYQADLADEYWEQRMLDECMRDIETAMAPPDYDEMCVKDMERDAAIETQAMCEAAAREEAYHDKLDPGRHHR